MHNKIKSAVLNNGSTGNYFKLDRGGRQGCPLSAYLFILVIEVLANKILNDPDIKGIKIDNKEIKISLLAEDITLILKDLSSLEDSLKTFKLFQHCSDLKLNIDKTKIKHIGKILNPDQFPHGISWIKTPLETLGIFITNDAEENLNLNFKPRIANLTNLFKCVETKKSISKSKNHNNQQSCISTSNLFVKYNRYP